MSQKQCEEAKAALSQDAHCNCDLGGKMQQLLRVKLEPQLRCPCLKMGLFRNLEKQDQRPGDCCHPCSKKSFDEEPLVRAWSVCSFILEQCIGNSEVQKQFFPLFWHICCEKHPSVLRLLCRRPVQDVGKFLCRNDRQHSTTPSCDFWPYPTKCGTK